MLHRISLAVLGLVLVFSRGEVYASAQSCSITLENRPTVQDMLNLEKRPTVEVLAPLALSKEGITFAKQYPRENEKQLFGMVRGAAMELFKISGGRKVFLFARDGELIHDAIATILMNHPDGQKLKPFFTLINVSRPIARDHSPQAVRTFLEHHGMDLRALIEGKEKMLWIDTGFRGSIYLSLFGTILDLIDFTKPSSEVNEQIVNVLTNVEALLITTKGVPSVDSIVQVIRSHTWQDAAQVINYLNSYLFFNEFLVNQRSALKLPETQAERYRWVVQNIEHNYHFNGRALTLNERSTEVANYEIDDETNKEYALGQQIRLIRAFKDESVQEEFAPVIDAILGKPQAPVVPKPKRPKAPIAVDQALTTRLKVGDLIKTEDGMILEYVSEGGTGRRGIVYKVKNTSGDFLALKLAKNRDADTLESFAEEGKKTDAALAAGFRVARILEHKKAYIVKEWVEGLMAKDWLKQWANGFYDRNDKPLIEIRAVLKESARRGLYTGDLNRKNLIWTGEWVVIDSGSTTNEYSPAEAWERYVKNISSRWAKELNNSVADEFKKALEE